MTADDNLDVLRFRDIFFYVRKLFYLAWVELDINFFFYYLAVDFYVGINFPSFARNLWETNKFSAS